MCWEFGGEYYLDGQVISMLSPTGADVVMKAVWVADSDPELVPNGDFSAAEEFNEIKANAQYGNENWLLYTNASGSKINSVKATDGALVFNATTGAKTSNKNFYVSVLLNLDSVKAGDKFVISFDAKTDNEKFTYTGAWIRAKKDADAGFKTITDFQEFTLTTDTVRYTYIAEATEDNVSAAGTPTLFYLVIGFDDGSADTATFTLDNVSVKKFTEPKAEKSLLEQKVTLISDRKEND